MIRFGIPDFDDHPQEIMREAAELIKLAEDLRFVAQQNKPNSPPEFDAPILEKWQLVERAVPCLVGLSTGHPILQGIRRQIITSEIHLISEELGWVRTRSRWYRLARRKNENSRES